MNPDRWRKVEKIFNQALEVDRSCRAAVIDESCAGDEALRLEVESLLAQHENAVGFIETPAFYASVGPAPQPPRLEASSSDSSLAGAVIGHYRVLSKIGSGGQGVVYEAEDLKLGRRAVLKFLPEKLSKDPQSVQRFRREARAASGLNHPNICTIYEVDEVEGQAFIAMEYIAGKTLDKLIPPNGLRSEIATKYALQIADALAVSHAAGIVHRDLKPSNLMVDESGVVKVLDFGLAKLVAPVSPGADYATTNSTTPGMIIGTVAYMSPEQAEGNSIDRRSDVFSFGSVLYEMLSGGRAFNSGSTAGLLSAVIRDEPAPLKALKNEIPPELRRIVTRCLRKEPLARYPSGSELLQELKKCRDLFFPESGTWLSAARIVREIRRPRMLVSLLVTIILLVAGATWFVKRSRDERWARNVALPEAFRLAEEGKPDDAYVVAIKAEKFVPSDPTLAKLWPKISYQISVETTPPGADVYSRDYVQKSAPWVKLGTTPLKNIRQPYGTQLWKFEKRGFGTVLRTTDTLFAVATLDEEGSIPPGMVRVSPEKYFDELLIPGYEGMPKVKLKDYWIDKYEVSNRQFKVFVDQGGYKKREYWKVDFRNDGKHMSWDEAMNQFRDATGRPGPKNWTQSDYPKGQDDFPVTGISWYEAAAYAQFANKSLPTIYHWNRAAGPYLASFIVPASNFGTSGILPIGSKQDLGPWGTYDMAGNVKEWIWTEAESGKRYVLGGAWDEPSYQFVDPDAQSPFLRASNIGFRCVKYIDPAAIPKVATQPMPSPRRDMTKEKPVSDQLFQAYRSLYSYDRDPLNALVEPLSGDGKDWKAEKITYSAGYGKERAISYLFLPTKAKPPFQTVLVFPGSNALLLRTFSLETVPAVDAILKSGRAVIYPVYKSTFERGDGMTSDVPDQTSSYRDHVIMWAKDASRAIDYAQTRPELDHDKIAYYGFSWGAAMGAIVPAVEPRIELCIIVGGGLEFQRSRPEVDIINFVPRVSQPFLMLNGRYDFIFPVHSTQEPFYRLLGSRKDQKKLLLYDVGHGAPTNEIIKESLNWLDHYYGAVN
jgi:tRNA A-37 threonylcarbamoyl transferase component Bud32/dienelactone hydrolase